MAERFVASENSQVQSSPPVPSDGVDGNRSSVGPAHSVGLVAGTEDSTPLQFAVALDEDSYLQLDDVVVTLRGASGVGQSWHTKIIYRGSDQFTGSILAESGQEVSNR